MPKTLSNADLAATTPEQRTWSLWHIAALWVGMAVCVPTYMLAAGMIQQGMSWSQAVATVMLGNLIVLVPMILNGHGGTKYGVPFPVLVRASFGTTGAHIPSMARALVACGWFGIQTWIGGAAIYQILAAIGWVDAAADMAAAPAWLGISLTQLACFLAFWAVHVAIVLRGIHSIKWLETWAAPFLILSGLALLVWAVYHVPNLGSLFQPARFERPEDFWRVFFPQLTAMVGFWATLSLNIPDFTRYCRSQREQAAGQLIGLPTTMTLFSFIGIAVTAATVAIFGEAIWNPVDLVGRLGTSPLVVAVGLLALTLATLSTNLAANIVSPANGFSNLWPSVIGFRAGAMITCLIGVAIMPWRLLASFDAYIFTWLIGYSALLGPIAGIMLADYYIVRRTRLNPAALYDPRGEYAGVNGAAVIALVLAVLPNLPGFINAASGRSIFPTALDRVYEYAWFVGLLAAAGIYCVLMRGRNARGGAAPPVTPDPQELRP
jgi:nucleobase:cation symporter-1, NCS1 family